MARLLIDHLPIEKMIVIVNRGADNRILFSGNLPPNVEVKKFNLLTPMDIGLFANRHKNNKVLYLMIKMIDYLLRYPLLVISYFYFSLMFRKLQMTHFLAHNGGYPGASYCLTATMAASKLKGVRCFFAFHSIPNPRRWTQGLLDDFSDRILDKICTMICVSAKSGAFLLSRRKFKQQPVCIYNGLNGMALKHYREIDKLRLLHVGYFDFIKNQIMLLRALKTLIDRGYKQVQLTLVGGISDEAVYREAVDFVERNRLKDYVRFEGFHRDVNPYYYENDVLVLSSKVESFPMVVLEAMRVGMPVVATTVGGVAEQIIDGRCGYLVVPEDHDGMAERIMRFIDNPGDVRKMGIEAHKIFGEKFALNKMVEGYTQALGV